jgi:hypothetical protein
MDPIPYNEHSFLSKKDLRHGKPSIVVRGLSKPSIVVVRGGTKLRSRLNGKRKGTRAVVTWREGCWFGTVLKVLGLPGGWHFWAAVNPWISPIQPPMVFVTEISFLFSQGFFG